MTRRPGPGARARRAAVLLAVLAAGILMSSAPASGHSELERSDPAQGGMVAPGPATLTFWFTEPVAVRASTFSLRGEDGSEVGTTVTSSGAGQVVRVASAPLARAVYTVHWRVLSLDDGHPSSGSVVFGAGLRPDVLPDASGGVPELPGLVLRWLDLSAVLLAIGALAVSGRVLAAAAGGSRLRRRALLVGLVAAATASLSGALTPVVATVGSGSSTQARAAQTWATLTGTPWGQLWLLREVAVLTAVTAVWAARRRRAAGRWVRVALAGLVAVAALESWAGHASGLPDRAAPAALASTVHVVAAGVWVGGLVALLLCLGPAIRRDPDRTRTALAPVWRAYGPMAAVAAVLLVSTGLYEAGRHVPDLRLATTTVYGAGVAGKLVLVAGALALAAMNASVVHPRLAARVGQLLGRPAGWRPVAPRRLPALLVAEVLVLVAAVGAAALLTSVPTSREIGTATRPLAPHAENVAGLFVTFEEVPGGPDRSRLLVRVRPTVLPAAAPVHAVEVELRGPSGTARVVPLRALDTYRFEAETDRPAPGRWTASVSVLRTALPPAVSVVRWTEPRPGAEPASSVQRWTTGLAVALLGLLAGLLVVVRRRRAPDPVPSAGPDQDTARVGQPTREVVGR